MAANVVAPQAPVTDWFIGDDWHHNGALILVHNHPSGDPTPSEADLSMTKEIQKGCKYLGLTLHDHIIVGRGRYVSFAEAGLL